MGCPVPLYRLFEGTDGIIGGHANIRLPRSASVDKRRGLTEYGHNEVTPHAKPGDETQPIIPTVEASASPSSGEPQYQCKGRHSAYDDMGGYNCGEQL